MFRERHKFKPVYYALFCSNNLVMFGKTFITIWFVLVLPLWCDKEIEFPCCSTSIRTDELQINFKPLTSEKI